jgi:hypothetical protein
MSLLGTYRKSALILPHLWQSGLNRVQQQSVARGHGRDIVLHARDGFLLRGTDVRSDEGGPSGTAA